MKKIIILSFALLCLFSCSSSDGDIVDPDTGEVVLPGDGDGDGDANAGGGDSGGNSGSGGDNSGGGDGEAKDPIIGTWNLFLGTDEVEVNDCLKKTTFIFNEDKSYAQIEFNDTNGNCEEIVNVTGEWTNKGNDTYELRRDGFTSGPNVPFQFSDDGKSMILIGKTYNRQ